MAGSNTVRLTLVGDSSKLEKALERSGAAAKKMSRDVDAASDKASSDLRSLGSAAQSTGDGGAAAFKKFGAAAAAFGATVVAAAGAAVVALIPLSRSIQDMDTKAQFVFQDQLPDIRKWAEANSKAFGTSTRQVVGMAANLADLLKPMGFTTKQASDMTKRLLNLAGALAKWSGGTKTAADVSEILTSAMLGERDSLKSLGISISAADVEARLALKGQKDLTGAALAQAEAVATQELIFEKSTDAQEAWAKGGRDAAIASGTLSSAVQTLKEKVAVLLTPAFAEATRVAGEFVDKASGKLDELVPKVRSFIDKELSDMTKALNNLKDNVLEGVKNGFDKIKVSVDANADSWRTLGDAITKIVDIAGPVIKWLVELIATAAGAALDWIATLIDAVKWVWDQLGKLPWPWKGGGQPASPQAPGGGGPGKPLPEFATGGMVPGPIGQPTLAVVHGGETVIPVGQSGGNGSVVIELRSSGSGVDDMLMEILRRAIKAQGGNVQLALGR